MSDASDSAARPSDSQVEALQGQMAAASVADAPEASSQTSPPPAKVPFDVARTDGVQVTRVFWLSNVPQEADDARRILADFAATFREQYIDRGGDARLSAQGDTSGFMLEYQMLRHFLPLFVDEQVAEEYPNSAAAQAYRARYKKDKDRPKVSLTGALLSQCFRFAVSPLPPSVLQQLIVARKTIWTLLLSNEKERIIEVFRDLPSPVTTDMLAFLNFALTIHPRCNAWVYSTAPKVGMKKVKMPNGDWTEVDDSGDIVFPVSIGFNADERKISSKWYDDNFDLAAETERECEELETNPPWDKVGIPIGTKGDNDGCQVLRSQCFWCRSCVLAQGTGKLSRCAGCLVPVYCSRDCQTTDWKAFHAQECASIQNKSSSLRPALLAALLYNRISTLVNSPNLKDATGMRAYHIFNPIDPHNRMPRRKGATGWDQYVLDLTGGVTKRGEFVNVPWWLEVVDKKYSEEVGADLVPKSEVEANPEKYGVKS